MALITILRNSSAALLRVPLLWLFTAVVLVTSDLVSLASDTSIWFSVLSLLLVPIALLAQAGQIKSVQLHQEGSYATIPQIVSHGFARIKQLIFVLVVCAVLIFFLRGLLWSIAKLLHSQPDSPVVVFLVILIASAIGESIMAFAQRGIIIADYPSVDSLFIGFQALRKDVFTVLAIVAIFSILRYSIIVSISQMNTICIAAGLLALLVAGAIQSTIFTYAYLHLIGRARREMQENLTDKQTPIEFAALPVSIEDHLSEPIAKDKSSDRSKHIPRARPAVLLSALAAIPHYFISGPGRIRKRLVEQGLAEASIAASKFSGALFFIMVGGSMIVSLGAFLLLFIIAPIISSQEMRNLFAWILIVVIALPMIIVITMMLLSVLAAAGLALVAFFKKTEEKSRAVFALLVSILILIGYAITTIGVIALSG